MSTTNFGHTLHVLRQASGASLEELAERSGLPRGELQRIENGLDGAPSAETIVGLAEALGVSSEDLLSITRDPHPEIIKYLRTFPEAVEFLRVCADRDVAGADFDLLTQVVRGGGAEQLRELLNNVQGESKTIADRETALAAGISAYVDPSIIFPKIKARQKYELFHTVARQLAAKIEGLDPDSLADMLKSRERQASTGIGMGLAIPHVFLEIVQTPLIGVARSLAGIDFDAVDGKPVHAVFFLLLPVSIAGSHIRLLSRVVRICNEDGFLVDFMRRSGREDLHKLILETDAKLG